MRNLAIYDDDLVMKPFPLGPFLEPTSTLILKDGEKLYIDGEGLCCEFAEAILALLLLPCYFFLAFFFIFNLGLHSSVFQSLFSLLCRRIFQKFFSTDT
jgi:hypothetical protein